MLRWRALLNRWQYETASRVHVTVAATNGCSLWIADSGFSIFSNTKTTKFLRPSHALLQLVLASIDGWSVTLLIYLPVSIFRADVYRKSGGCVFQTWWHYVPSLQENPMSFTGFGWMRDIPIKLRVLHCRLFVVVDCKQCFLFIR
jgi:hypothetical protein